MGASRREGDLFVEDPGPAFGKGQEVTILAIFYGEALNDVGVTMRLIDNGGPALELYARNVTTTPFQVATGPIPLATWLHIRLSARVVGAHAPSGDMDLTITQGGSKFDEVGTDSVTRVTPRPDIAKTTLLVGVQRYLVTTKTSIAVRFDNVTATKDF